MRTSIAISVLFAFFAGCALFCDNPLDRKRGAVVLVFDTRTCGDLKVLRQLLSAYDARATVFAGGQVQRGLALALHDLSDDGCEIGLSGLRGVDPQSYSLMYGHQKYFQDEIVTQLLDARKYNLNPRYFLLGSLSQAKSATLALPSFLVSKGFDRVLHKMPDSMRPRAKSVAELDAPVLHVYSMMTTNAFDRAQIAALARHDEILIVSPSRQVLREILEEARAQGVPFATVADIRRKRP